MAVRLPLVGLALLAARLSVRGVEDWLLKDPLLFHQRAAQVQRSGPIDVSNDPAAMAVFGDLVDRVRRLQGPYGFSDLEVVDALEHFFWGSAAGVALELGAVDGTPARVSMTYDMEHSLNWTRILVEANPKFRRTLQRLNPSDFTVHAAICAEERIVHFAFKAYVSGILELMETSFIQKNFPVAYHIFNTTNPPQRWDLVDWSKAQRLSTERNRFDPVSCVPLAKVFSRAAVRHVNFFVLDVEGGELSVLRSVDWNAVKFDVLCVETEPCYRPPGYTDALTTFLAEKGYGLYASRGRNSWFIRNDFSPSARPGVHRECFRGVESLYRNASLYRVVAFSSPERVNQPHC